MTTLFTPTPGDRVQVGNSTDQWIVGEIVERRYQVANLHTADGRTAIGVPLSELHVVIPYEARPEPKWLPESVPTESEAIA